MRKVVLLFFLMAGISYADIKWLSLEDGFSRAQKEKKIVLIYIYSPKCHYCKKMEATTFKSPQVQEIVNKYFIPVKVRKCSEDGAFVKEEYGYLGTPTFHFVKPDGTKIKSLFGAWSKEEFLKILRYFYSGAYKQKSMNEFFTEEK